MSHQPRQTRQILNFIYALQSPTYKESPRKVALTTFRQKLVWRGHSCPRADAGNTHVGTATRLSIRATLGKVRRAQHFELTSEHTPKRLHSQSETANGQKRN